MPIEKTKFRGKEVITVEGELQAIYINEIPKDKIKTYTGTRGQPWTPTHRYNVVVDGTRISLGMGDKDGVTFKQELRSKDTNDNYQTLARGMIVSVEVTENGEYNGVQQYQSSVSKVVITDMSNAQTPVTTQGGTATAHKQPYKPKDNTQVVAGNARTAAFELMRGEPWDIDVLKDNIAKLVVYSDKKRKQYAKDNPDLDEFQVGVSVGQAVVLAAQFATDVDELDDYVDPILEELVPFSVDEVKAVTDKAPKAESKVTQKKAAPAKSVRKAVDVEPEPVDDYVDDDDSTPF